MSQFASSTYSRIIPATPAQRRTASDGLDCRAHVSPASLAAHPQSILHPPLPHFATGKTHNPHCIADAALRTAPVSFPLPLPLSFPRWDPPLLPSPVFSAAPSSPFPDPISPAPPPSGPPPSPVSAPPPHTPDTLSSASALPSAPISPVRHHYHLPPSRYRRLILVRLIIIKRRTRCHHP